MLIGLPEKVTKIENNHCEHPNARPMSNYYSFLSEDFGKRCNILESETLARKEID